MNLRVKKTIQAMLVLCMSAFLLLMSMPMFLTVAEPDNTNENELVAVEMDTNTEDVGSGGIASMLEAESGDGQDDGSDGIIIDEDVVSDEGSEEDTAESDDGQESDEMVSDEEGIELSAERAGFEAEMINYQNQVTFQGSFDECWAKANADGENGWKIRLLSDVKVKMDRLSVVSWVTKVGLIKVDLNGHVFQGNANARGDLNAVFVVRNGSDLEILDESHTIKVADASGMVAWPISSTKLRYLDGSGATKEADILGSGVGGIDGKWTCTPFSVESGRLFIRNGVFRNSLTSGIHCAADASGFVAMNGGAITDSRDHGIHLTKNITWDLSGGYIAGCRGFGMYLESDTTIKNMVIARNGSTGRSCGGVYSPNVIHLNNTSVCGNLGNGVDAKNIRLEGTSSVMRNDGVGAKASEGVFLTNQALISGNTSHGVHSGKDTRMFGNAEVSSNGGHGVLANNINIGDEVRIKNNKKWGVYVTDYSYISTNQEISGNQEGGIHVSDSTVKVAGNTKVRNNGPCGIWSAKGVYLESKVEVSGHKGGDKGGGVYADEGFVFMYSDVKVINNSAKSGGGIYVDGPNVANKIYISGRCEVSGNTATDGDGGGVWSNGHIVVCDAGSLRNNTASGNGGACYSVTGECLFSGNGGLFGNKAANGGAIYAENSLVNINNITVSGNIATNDGGAIYEKRFRWVQIFNKAVVSGNRAMNGGAIFHNGDQLKCVRIYGDAVLQDNIATGDGGAVHGNADVWGNAQLVHNQASKGGAVYGGMTLNGDVRVAGNTAEKDGSVVYAAGLEYVGEDPVSVGGTVIVSENTGGLHALAVDELKINSSAKIENNTFEKYLSEPKKMDISGACKVINNSAGIYLPKNEVTIKDKPVIRNEMDGRDPQGLVLAEDVMFRGEGWKDPRMQAGAEVWIETESMASMVPFYGNAFEGDSSRFHTAMPKHLIYQVGNTIYLMTDGFSSAMEVPLHVYLNGESIKVGNFARTWREIMENGSVEMSVFAEDSATALNPYGFAISKYNGEPVFGQIVGDKMMPLPVVRQDVQDPGGDSGNDNEGEDVSEGEDKGESSDIVTGWRMKLYDNKSCVYYLPNGISEDGVDLSKVTTTQTFYSVRILDTYFTITQEGEDLSHTVYVKAGGSLDVELDRKPDPWEWKVAVLAEDNFDHTVDDSDENKVIFHLSNIHSQVLIANYSDNDVTYTTQYYGYVHSLDVGVGTGSPNEIRVIDTRFGMPVNDAGVMTMREKFLTVDPKTGEVRRTRGLYKIFSDSSFIYSSNPRLSRSDKLKGSVDFLLSEIWVLKEGNEIHMDSLDPSYFDVYKKSDFPELDSLRDIHITMNPNKVDKDRILVYDRAVIRYVYEPCETEVVKDTRFLDYDVTDGYLYKSETCAETDENRVGMSYLDTIEKPEYQVLRTHQKGINSQENYYRSGARMGFGNGNVYMGLEDEGFVDSDGKNVWINIGNKAENDSYRNCAFKLLSGINRQSNGIYRPLYSEGVQAPNLFGIEDAIGKTEMEGWQLKFDKSGFSYVLSGVPQAGLDGLDTFNHPVCGTSVHTHIWTNNFWPMDAADTGNTDGHDPMFGAYERNSGVANKDAAKNNSGGVYHENGITKYYNYIWPSKNTSWLWKMPLSDDGLDHNSFFGMTTTIKFKLPKDYCGPLEYCFFGDDDMWVFLDDKQIIDIGGVHSSIGQYANLWDHIEYGDTDEHELTFFYTERGASGSSCWMNFTIPYTGFGTEKYELDEGSFTVKKKVIGDDNHEHDGEEYEFHVQMLDDDGNPSRDDFMMQKYDKDGIIISRVLAEDGVADIKLKDGERFEFIGIPEGFKYVVTEKDPGCYVEWESNRVTARGAEASGEIVKGEDTVVTVINDFDTMRMPDTGVTNRYAVLWLGAACIVIGLAALYGSRRRYR